MSDHDVVHDFLDSIRHVPVLSRDAVRDLCIEIEVGVLAAERAAGVSGSTSEHRDLAVLVRRGTAAQQRLIVHNLKLVVSVARKAASRAFDFEDLIQAGNAGLVTAVQKFDWRLGFAFSTYASWWIRKAVSLEIANDRTIRLPAAPLRQFLELVRLERAMGERGPQSPSTAELAEASGLDRATVAALQRVGRPTLSLTHPVTADGETVLMDVLQADGPGLAEQLHRRQVLEAVGTALGELAPLPRQILAQRYGLGADAPRTPQRIAQLTHLPVAEIVHLERTALEQLKRRLEPLHAG